MKLIFAGTPAFAATALEALLAHQFTPVAVYTQPDRPSGRGMKLQPSPVKKLAVEHDIPVCQPPNFKDPAELEKLAAWRPDLMIVAAYGLLLPPAVLELPRFGCINIHASLLPRWRGAAPIIRAIEAGDAVTGITLMKMDKGLDTGDILDTAECAITDQETGGSLHDKLARMGATRCVNFLQQWHQTPLQGETQNQDQATYARKLTKEEAHLDWQQPARVLERRIRAFNPWPVAYTHHGDQRLRLWRAQIPEVAVSTSQPQPPPPGQLVHVSGAGIDVATGDGVLRLLTLQRPGGKPVEATALLNAYPLRPGERFQ